MTNTEKLHRATTALKYLQTWNLVQNNWQAYQLAVTRWGLGLRKTLPRPEDYGVDERMALKEKQ